jgi:UDP-2,3-diacylglucosamine pyrophosphatase LpxH
VPDIRYVILSDLHFGAENSVLTRLLPSDVQVDLSAPGNVMKALVECLRTVVEANAPRHPPTLILNGDVLELALADDHVAATVFEQFVELTFSRSDRMFAKTAYFVPGNHDHHLWESARERHYAQYVRSVPVGEPLQPAWHSTRLLQTLHDDRSVAAELLTALAHRASEQSDMDLQTVYPNLGFVSDDGRRAVVVHHGHYVESMYTLMSTLNLLMFEDALPEEAWEWESENFAWIDFFWSTLGRSGDVGKNVALAYDALRSSEATERLIDNLASGLAEQLPTGRLRRRAVAKAARIVLNHAATRAAAAERRHPAAILSADAEEGLRRYVEGPVFRQLRRECNGEVPGELTFIFGHTHKPFAEPRSFSGFTEPVKVFNTGGWVVDDLKPMPLHGAAVVLVDEHLDAVLLTMYTQHDNPGDYRVTVTTADGTESDLSREIAALLDPARDPWRGFAVATADAVAERNRDLETIIKRAAVPIR